MKPQDLLDRLAAGYEYDPMYGALCNERDQLKAENEKLREFANEMFKEILLLPEYQMGSERKKHFIDKAIELGLKGYA